MTFEELARGSGWTVDTVLQYFTEVVKSQNEMLSERAKALDKRLDERADSSQRAIEALALANEKALAKVDEKTEKQFAEMRNQLVLSSAETTKKIDDLKDFRSQSAGRDDASNSLRGTMYTTVGLMIGVGGLAVAYIN